MELRAAYLASNARPPQLAAAAVGNACARRGWHLVCVLLVCARVSLCVVCVQFVGYGGWQMFEASFVLAPFGSLTRLEGFCAAFRPVSGAAFVAFLPLGALWKDFQDSKQG